MGGKGKSFSGPKRQWGDRISNGKGGKGLWEEKGETGERILSGKDLREAKGDELREKDLGRKGGERSLGGKWRRTEGGKRPWKEKGGIK